MFQDKKKCVVCKHGVRCDNENIMQRDAADFQLISAHVDNISSNKVCVHIFNELSHGDIAMNACNSGKITRDVS